ncbi:MAG: MoxR family ATPase [Bernardetiaceae bacterium]|nr:MoxR family ATPase [Bernardetiaceae bacterium]
MQEEENHFEQNQEEQTHTSNLDLSKIRDAVDKVRGEIHRYVIGQNNMIDQLLAALFTGGHVLIEGAPGIAKTLTAKLMAKALAIDFSRIQFTPDLMPTDIVGTNVYNMKNSEFQFMQGPIFANLILIDEINRSPAKTQAALFEAMEEKQATIDGKTYKFSEPFFVIATQNPIEQEGTYRLPEAQLDRFLFRIVIDYPNLEEEKEILRRFKNNFTIDFTKIEPIMQAEEILACRNIVETLYIKDNLLDYIADIVCQTRNNGNLFLGASPRASLAIMRTSKAFAAMAGRDFVTPEDIQKAAYPVLNHRIILTPESEMEGYTPTQIIKEMIEKIEVPR